MRRILALILALLIVTGEFAPVMGQGLFFGRQYQQVQQQNGQQQPRRRTLLDMLFGPRDNQYQNQQVAPPVQRKPQPAQLPPVKPTIAKADNATRVAVFGDSLAADVGKALDRLYANDPNIAVQQQAVGASGFARQDYFDWNKTIGQQIAANSFDVAVMMIGINDRQQMTLDGKAVKSLTDDWNKEYSARLVGFLSQLRAANKPVIWIGLPPMAAPQFSDAMNQLSSLERLAAFANGAEFIDIYDKFLDENGNYAQNGPDVTGQDALMRKSDGVHFTNAGADKVAFYASQSIRLFAHGGAGLAVVDPLAGSDAAVMLRPPYQGLGQSKLLQVAGAVVPLTGTQPRANDLIEAGSGDISSGFDMKQLLEAPIGRADAFGVGIDPETANAGP
ncbi:MAG: DUF459 domain-containing protein [Devosia sp.]|nr:DUF459 domain-containing protein [Devosia sp.]